MTPYNSLFDTIDLAPDTSASDRRCSNRDAMSDRDRALQWAKAFSHPVRVQILVRLLDGEPASPSDIARMLALNLGVISYHMRTLDHLGVVTLTRRTSVRGALKHHYKLTDFETTRLALHHADTLAGRATLAETGFDPRNASRLASLGQALRELREASGVTLTDLAQRTSIDAAYLERVERGEVDPCVSDLCRLADSFATTVADIFSTACRSLRRDSA